MATLSGYTIGPKNYTDEWHNLRVLDPSRQPQFVCGASEAGVICGVSKYKTRLELYMEKRALKERRPDSEIMQWGRRLEGEILTEYAARMEVGLVRPDHMLLWKENPQVAASPDGIATDGSEDHCVDAKCTTSRMYDALHCRERDCFGEGEDEIPTDYLMQAQQQMLVTDTGRCDFPVLFDGNKLRIYSVERNDDVIKRLIDSIEEFCESVALAHPPEPDWGHDTTLALVKQGFALEPGFEIEMPEEGIEYFDTYVDAKEEIGRLTKVKEGAMAHMLYLMGDAATATIPARGKIVSRVQVGEKLWTQKDIETATDKFGTVKRKGFVRVSERKM